MIHVTIFFSFYCWPSAWGWLNGQQKENEDVSTWIIDSWPWKSFLLLGFNLQHITISLKLDRAVGWKRFQEKENDARSRNPSRSRHHTSFHLFSFFSWERIMKENNKWKRSCETIVMRAKRCLLFFFEEAIDRLNDHLIALKWRKRKTSSMLRSFSRHSRKEKGKRKLNFDHKIY